MDNVNLRVQRTRTSRKLKTKQLNHIHSFYAKDRIVGPEDENVHFTVNERDIDNIPLEKLLFSPEDEEGLHKDLEYQVRLILKRYFLHFAHCDASRPLHDMSRSRRKKPKW